MIPDVDRILIITPRLDGDDGVSEVSRQVVAACAAVVGSNAIEAWALAGGTPTGTLCAMRSAGGSRSRLAGWAIRAAARATDGLLVLVLHLHLAPIALPIALRGARSACFLHGIEAWRRLRPRERASLAAATVILANSHWTAESFRAANPAFRTRQIAVCPLGLRDAPPPQFPDCNGYALIVGRLSAEERYKGHDLLLDVWPSVVELVPGAHLVIVGDGDDRGRLERLAATKGIADRVRFAGRVPDTLREGFYRNAALFVMPSTGEGFGLAYLEAMRAGTPCIAAPGAPAEIVEHGVTGFVVDPGAPQELIEAVVSLFSDRDLRDRLGRAGADRVARQFLARHFARNFVAGLALGRDVVTA